MYIRSSKDKPRDREAFLCIHCADIMILRPRLLIICAWVVAGRSFGMRSGEREERGEGDEGERERDGIEAKKWNSRLGRILMLSLATDA